MANTLTYDPTELPEGQLTEEEMNSLEVGEQLAQEQEQLLAGKYKNAEDLEAAYIELQRKLGEGTPDKDEVETDTEEEEDVEEVSPAVSLIQEASTEYYQNDGKLSPETLAKFGEMSSQELVQAYMELQAQQPQQLEATPDLSQAEVNVIQNAVGGEAAYQNLVGWAAENLPDDYISAFDNVVESGNLQAIQLAVAGLRSEYEKQVGYEGRMLSGKAAAPQDGFRSQAEVVRAMQDPRYDSDPAYRYDVEQKLERSNIQF